LDCDVDWNGNYVAGLTHAGAKSRENAQNVLNDQGETSDHQVKSEPTEQSI
jgi:hypothetical protein